MRHMQQVMCQRFAQSLRVLLQVLRMTQEAAQSDCRSDLPLGCDWSDDVRIEATPISFNDRVRPKGDVEQRPVLGSPI
jgi:hypothetical protein